MRDQGPRRGEQCFGCYIERNRKERVLELKQHLHVKTIAEGYVDTMTRMIPAEGGSVPL